MLSHLFAEKPANAMNANDGNYSDQLNAHENVTVEVGLQVNRHDHDNHQQTDTDVRLSFVRVF